MVSEVLQLDGQEEGDQTEEDAHQENVGLVVTPEGFESGDNRVIGKELKQQCSIPFVGKHIWRYLMGSLWDREKLITLTNSNINSTDSG